MKSEDSLEGCLKGGLTWETNVVTGSRCGSGGEVLAQHEVKGSISSADQTGHGGVDLEP